MVEALSSVGPVQHFRLVWDRETGKPKGFGFATFRDAGTAASAVRNLNGHELGGRMLRVDFADAESRAAEETAGTPSVSSGGVPSSSSSSSMATGDVSMIDLFRCIYRVS